MSNVRLWWLTPPGESERPTQTGFFVWKGRGHQTARIVGVLSSVAGCVSPQDPRVVEVRVGEGIDPCEGHGELPRYVVERDERERAEVVADLACAPEIGDDAWPWEVGS